MTTQLTKGQNTQLAAGHVVVSVDVALPVDVSALLVASTGKVRSDADFVFFNQPTAPGVTLRPDPSGGAAASVLVDVDVVPPDVDRVRIVVSIDESGKRFGQVPHPLPSCAIGRAPS